jgi:KUP system potassium uptake protein
VIASQALITAAFSVAKQASSWATCRGCASCTPREVDTGQIYVPVVNWGLYVCIVLAVVLFKSSVEPGLGLRHRGHLT